MANTIDRNHRSTIATAIAATLNNALCVYFVKKNRAFTHFTYPIINKMQFILFDKQVIIEKIKFHTLHFECNTLVSRLLIKDLIAKTKGYEN